MIPPFEWGKDHIGGRAVSDLIFWAMVADDDMLGPRGAAKARWLSLLQPREQTNRSYIAMRAPPAV